jgi:putative DNA methylase
MPDEAKTRISYLYPQAKLSDGSNGNVIAWLWVRTVRSPDPAAKGAMVPLVSSFMLSTKDNSKVWAEPIIDPNSPDGYRFEVKSGRLLKADEERLKKGTKSSKGNFTCLLTGSAISEVWNRSEGQAKRLGRRLLAVVAESNERRRIFLSPTPEHEAAELTAECAWEPEGELFAKALGVRVPAYGMTRWADLYTRRQLVALTTLSDLVSEARELVLQHARDAGFSDDSIRLRDGGLGADAYADAVATYLAFVVDRAADYGSTLSTWLTDDSAIRSTFGRQTLSMTWDYCEGNFFGNSSAALTTISKTISSVVELLRCTGQSRIDQIDATKNGYPVRPCIINTDPPYYDNIGFADLSDFFYVWLRPSLSSIWPDLFRRVVTPKDEELVATPGRHGGKKLADAFFMLKMSEALEAMQNASSDDYPLAIYYAFKQAEAAEEGIASSGWASFLQAVVDAGLSVDGTWPMRTESAGRLRAQGSNALASAIVLVCRKRHIAASVATRAEFIRALKREMPEAIDDIRKAGVGPVDMQQSIIGPGMGVFSRYAKVLEDDDSIMPVKTALSLINRVWEEIENELDANFDAETQVALAWFATYGFEARTSGELITLANAKDIASNTLFASDVFKDMKGKTALTPRDELPKGWTPAADKTFTIWECVQHTARVLNAEDGGGAAASRLVAEMGPKAAAARALAYRLYEIASQKGWAAEALIYNELAQEWPKLEELATTAGVRNGVAPAQPSLF